MGEIEKSESTFPVQLQQRSLRALSMNVSIILAHPNLGSFNHAIAATAADTLRHHGHAVVLRDLCAEQFDPLMPAAEFARDARLDAVVARHCEEVVNADGIIVVHPNWWAMPPAILKGWLDRVLRPEVAYRFVAGNPVGLLKAKAAVVFNTSNTPAELERALYDDPLETLWKKCIFSLCGVPQIHRRLFSVVITSTSEQRAAWLDEVRATVTRFFPHG
jgi:putative NADPH-quinone reductase